MLSFVFTKDLRITVVTSIIKNTTTAVTTTTNAVGSQIWQPSFILNFKILQLSSKKIKNHVIKG